MMQAAERPAQAPEYIAPDTYTGRHVIVAPGAHYRVALGTAGAVAALAATGAMWESFGEVTPGREGFARTRYIADAAGGLSCYDSTGRLVIRHPASRRLRLLIHA